MASYRTELLARLQAMEHEALDAWVIANINSDFGGIDTYPGFIYTQDSYPYIVHRIGTGTPGADDAPDNLAEEIDIRTYEVVIRVIFGHLTSNYDGVNEALMNEMIPILEDYLLEHPTLRTDAGTYETNPNWTWATPASLIETSGIVTFPASGTGATQIGEELTLEVSVLRQLTLAD